jgi:hypothetical protein
MTSDSLQNEILEIVPKLLNMARELTWNRINDNCKYILSEILDSQDNFGVQRKARKKKNDLKTPLPLQEIMPELMAIYDDLYDINLHIYRADKNLTIIEIRYYPKSSQDPEYRKTIVNNPPMLHARVSSPPWTMDKTKKFDINWEHQKEWMIDWKLFWARQKLK